MSKQPSPLTEQERAFAAEHHGLVFRYMERHGLAEDEYYDVIVFGYLNGVQKYFRREDLNRRFAFTTLAWRAMDSCRSSYQRAKTRPKNRAETLRIHELLHSTYALENILADTRDYAQEVLDTMQIQETLRSFEQTERELVRLLMDGYSKPAVCKKLGLTGNQFYDILSQIQSKAMNSPLMQAA